MRVHNFKAWRVLHYADHRIHDYQLAFLNKPERDKLFNEIVYSTFKDEQGDLHLVLYNNIPEGAGTPTGNKVNGIFT